MIDLLGAQLTAILMLTVVMVVLAFGHPIAFTFAGVGLFFGYLIRGDGVFFIFTSQTMNTMDSWMLAAVTMFILIANLMVNAGIA